MAKKTKSTKKVATAKKTELLRIESTSAYTSKKEWKVSSRKNWPLPDNPLLRHTEAKASLSHLGGGDPKRAEERAVAIVTTEAMGTTALALPGNGPVPPQVGANNWSQLGPMAIPNGQTYSAARVLVSGRVTAIAIDPTATNTIYIGTAQGGIWKTTDGGLSWDAKSDNEVSLAIGALALDPQLPQIIYAGTGEGNFSGDSYYGLGILKSVDGGNTWVNLAQSTFSGNRFSRIVIVPSTAGTASTDLFAATNGGLFRSTNGGNSWTQLTSGLPTSSAATDVVIDPSVPTTIYVGFWNRGIFKSTNANVAAPSFSQLITGLPVATAAIPNGISRIALSIAPSSSQTIFALMANNDNTNYPSHSGAPYNYAVDKFYVSIDGGTNWSAISLPGPVTDGIGGQGFYNLNVVVDPTTPDIVYLSGISLWKAVKSGISWTITDIGAAFHPDNHAIAVRPGNHLAVYAGSDGGIYKTLNGGTTWDDSINKGLSIAQLEFIDQHPTSTEWFSVELKITAPNNIVADQYSITLTMVTVALLL